MSSSKENNFLGELLMWLILIGLFVTANDDEKHWSARIAAAAILSAFPVFYGFMMVAEFVSSANQATDSSWGFALLFLIIGGSALAWLLSIVYRSISSVEPANGWLVVPFGLFASALCVVKLWSLDIGWWNILAVPFAYFVVCASVEELFSRGVSEEDVRISQSDR